MKNKVWVGGNDDWLVVSSNRCDIELLNLITGAIVGLLSFPTMDMYAIGKSLDLIQASEHCTRTLRRIVLCQTPSDRGGHMAISLFDNWEIGYTTKGDAGWRTITHEKYFIEKQPYFPEVFVDVVLHKKSLVVVDIFGVVFWWHMGEDEVTVTYKEYLMSATQPKPSFTSVSLLLTILFS
jgi:hypothetical protein